MLLASGGYLLVHHHAFTISNPTSPPPAGVNSTPCDCTTSPPPPCECGSAATEEEMARNNRRPNINLQIVCPTPPPLVDRQVMLSLFLQNDVKTHGFPGKHKQLGRAPIPHAATLPDSLSGGGQLFSRPTKPNSCPPSPRGPVVRASLQI